MSKLVIMGTVEVAPERRDQVLPLLMSHRARCLKDEPGTLTFEVTRPRNDDTKVMLYEVYADDAAFEARRNGDSIKQVNAEAAEILVNVSGPRCPPVE